MKSLIFLIPALLASVSLFSQKWVHTIGLVNQDEDSRRVIEHYDKGYILTVTTSEGYNDATGWLIKTDINGNVLWDKVIGVDPDQVIIEKTVFDDQGNLYIFGLLWGDLESFYPLIIKLNPCGEQQWCRLLYFDEYLYGSFYDGILLENGDLLAVANMPDELQYDMIFLFCISSDGEFKWKQSYASRENYPMFDMRLGSRIQFFDDIYIISGYVYSPHPNYPTVSSIRPMFIGIDTLFNEQWVLQFGLEDNMKGKAYEVIHLSDSLFMGVGIHRFIENSNEVGNTFLMFFNQDGLEQKYKVISNDKFAPDIKQNFIYDVARLNDSLFLGASCIGEYYQGSPWGEMIVDTSGEVYKYKIREGTSGGSTNMIKTFDDKYAIACSYQYPNLSYDVYFYKVNDSLEQDTVYPGSYTYDSLCPYQIQSGVIDLTGCTVITDIKDIPWLADYIELYNVIEITSYPNPAETEITLSFQNTEHHNNMLLECYNIYGQKVHSEKIYKGQQQTKLDVSGWSKGLYLAVVKSNGKVAGRVRFVRK